MKILVTGAAGFLGSHLAETHLEKGHQVVGVDNFCTGLKENAKFLQQSFSQQFQFVEADVSKPWDTWAQSLSGVSRVYHFASPASPPLYQKLALETMAVNSLGTLQALEFATRAQARLVFASTSEIYGDPLVHPQVETYWGNVNTLGPRACYDESKRFGETLITAFNEKRGTQHGMVRIFNTYGPRMNPADGRVVINLLMQALRGEGLTVYGDGKQTRSFCYVSDLIAGIVAYGDREGLSEPVNVGNDGEFTILELAQVVQKIFSTKKLQIVHLPLPKDDPRQRKPELTRAREKLSPWKPMVSLEEGLRKMLDFMGSQPQKT